MPRYHHQSKVCGLVHDPHIVSGGHVQCQVVKKIEKGLLWEAPAELLANGHPPINVGAGESLTRSTLCTCITPDSPHQNNGSTVTANVCRRLMYPLFMGAKTQSPHGNATSTPLSRNDPQYDGSFHFLSISLYNPSIPQYNGRFYVLFHYPCITPTSPNIMVVFVFFSIIPIIPRYYGSFHCRKTDNGRSPQV